MLHNKRYVIKDLLDNEDLGHCMWFTGAQSFHGRPPHGKNDDISKDLTVAVEEFIQRRNSPIKRGINSEEHRVPVPVGLSPVEIQCRL